MIQTLYTLVSLNVNLNVLCRTARTFTQFLGVGRISSSRLNTYKYYFLFGLQFVFDLVWQVVAGEESKEVECQNQRVMRVLEAVYPRPSAIPQKYYFPLPFSISILVNIVLLLANYING